MNADSGGEFAAGLPEPSKSNSPTARKGLPVMKRPIVQAVITVVCVIVVLKLISPFTAKIPVVGQYLTLS